MWGELWGYGKGIRTLWDSVASLEVAGDTAASRGI